MEGTSHSTLPVTQTRSLVTWDAQGRAGQCGAERILPVPGCWDPALEAGDSSGTQEASPGHSFPPIQTAFYRGTPCLRLEPQCGQSHWEAGPGSQLWRARGPHQ